MLRVRAACSEQVIYLFLYSEPDIFIPLLSQYIHVSINSNQIPGVHAKLSAILVWCVAWMGEKWSCETFLQKPTLPSYISEALCNSHKWTMQLQLRNIPSKADSIPLLPSCPLCNSQNLTVRLQLHFFKSRLSTVICEILKSWLCNYDCTEHSFKSWLFAMLN